MTGVKCLVWDLDDTLWDGVLLEGDRPRPFPPALRTLRALDERGILHAVASRGDHAAAVSHLAGHGLAGLFCVLEVGWGAKSAAIGRIAGELNISLDAIAFADNDAAERAEVAAALPAVRCYPADRVGELPGLPEFQPAYVTAESRQRRQRYQVELRRAASEREFAGPPQEFLAGLGLVMTIRPAAGDDLARAAELTVRTHQLNTTGQVLSMERLRELAGSARHEVLVAGLADRFGDYGTIGLAVVSHEGGDAVLDLLLMSCRVMSRGVGAALLGQVVRRAAAAGRRPAARFVVTPVNRVMLVTLRFAGFEVTRQDGGRLLLARDPALPPPALPAHVRIIEGSSA